MKPSIQQLQELIDLYSSGKFDIAEKTALLLTEKFPNHSLSWKVLCAILAQTNRKHEALSHAKKVTNISPQDAEAFNNLANLYKALGFNQDAYKNYKKAISLNPSYAEAFNNFALIQQENHNYKEAEDNYKKAISLKPNYIQALNNLGVLYKDAEKFDEAIIFLNKAIQLKNDYFQALNNLGVTYQLKGDYENALNNLSKAIHFKNNYPEAYNNLGITFNDLRKYTEAEESFKKAILIRPEYAQAYNNLGTTHKYNGKIHKAIKCYEKAISINPSYAEAHNNLGVCLKDLNNFNASEDCFKKSIEIRPDYAEAYYNLSFVMFHQFKFQEGFQFYEWRWKTKQKIGNEFKSNKPLWRGEPNKNILVWKEQGIGDEIMFSSNLSDLLLKCKKLILLCDKRLNTLFKRSFVGQILFKNKIEDISDNDFDFHIPIGSLPLYLRNDLDSFKNSSDGFLISDKKYSHYLRNQILNNQKNKIIGISWNTKSIQNLSPFRSIELKQLVKIFKNLNVKIVNLQYGDTQKEIQNLKNETGIEIINIDEIDKFNDIDGLASLISACDLVVSIDNITVHLSGSLGVDTRVLLPINPDARWSSREKTSYWYKQMKLYRQKKINDWSLPLNELSNDLYHECIIKNA